MVSTCRGRTSVDIKSYCNTCQYHSRSLSYPQSQFFFYTVSCVFGFGKHAVVIIFRSGKSLQIWCFARSLSNVIKQATKFMAACYGYPNEETMSSLRCTVWFPKMSNKKLNAALDLKSLPPTTKAFKGHVYSAHLQAAIWRSALDPDLLAVYPLDYGWSLSGRVNMLSPVVLPPDVSPAPVKVLRLSKCGCFSS